MEDFIKKQEEEMNIWIEYIIMCDDVRRPKQFQPDVYFRLWETEKLSETIQVYESLDLKYDLVIQTFDRVNDTVVHHITIKSDNALNLLNR